jgi:hypothetical protein
MLRPQRAIEVLDGARQAGARSFHATCGVLGFAPEQ